MKEEFAYRVIEIVPDSSTGMARKWGILAGAVGAPETSCVFAEFDADLSTEFRTLLIVWRDYLLATLVKWAEEDQLAPPGHGAARLALLAESAWDAESVIRFNNELGGRLCADSIAEALDMAWSDQGICESRVDHAAKVQLAS